MLDPPAKLWPLRTDHRPWIKPAVLYLVVSAAGHLGWEAVHVRLYTVWDASPAVVRFAVLHCTAGDVMIATAVALAAWFSCGRPPAQRRFLWQLCWGAMALGIAFTAFSEWLNVAVLRSWAYLPAMPLVPGTGIGLTPILQWLVLPLLAFAAAWGAMPRDAASAGPPGRHP